MSNRAILVGIAFAAFLVSPAKAALVVKVGETKQAKSKAVIKLTLKNTFTEKIESARATIFLINSQKQVVGQATHWVIGGTKEQPPISHGKTITYHFVVPVAEPFATTKVTFTRMIFEGGRAANPITDIQIDD